FRKNTSCQKHVSGYRRIGVSGYRRGGVGTSRPVGAYSSGCATLFTAGPLSGLNHPAVRRVDHLYDLGQDFVAGVIKFVEYSLLQVTVSKGDLNMDLGLGGLGLRVIQLGNKSRLVAPLSPRLS